MCEFETDKECKISGIAIVVAAAGKCIGIHASLLTLKPA